MSKRKTITKKTYTKKMVKVILALSCVWITLSYILAFLGHEQIAETLSSTVASVEIATILGYLCKAYFETKEQERMKFKYVNRFGNEEDIANQYIAPGTEAVPNEKIL